jgi:uncharacterized RDD family membrane protein YckC
MAGLAVNQETNEVDVSQAPLATRTSRLVATVIDSTLLAVILIPIEYNMDALWLAAFEHHGIPIEWQMRLAAIAVAIFVLVQIYPLAKRAQTWGMQMAGIKITDMGGNRPSFAQLFARYAAYLLICLAPSFFPTAGGSVWLVNVLLIFRTDRRCGHDLISGTRVVEAARID